MKITRMQLRQFIFEQLMSEADADADTDTDTDADADYDTDTRMLPFGVADSADGPPVSGVSSVPNTAALLSGGPIQKFLTEPVLPPPGETVARYNIGSDRATLVTEPEGGLDPRDPDTVRPDDGYSKMLFVVAPDDRSESDLEPRAAWQNREMHQGQDIFGVLGDEVPAYIHGYVDRAELEGGAGGNVVILATAAPIGQAEDGKNIYPAGTEFVRYAHLDTISTRAGDTIYAGVPVGTMGCTGNCGTKRTAPHIHLSVSRADSRGKFNWSSRYHRDPYDLFDQAGWVTNRSDLYLAEASVYRAVEMLFKSIEKV